jgi:membrane protease subunit (stomatin/prohibitin family)
MSAGKRPLTEEVSNYLRDMLIQGFTNALATSKIPALDLAMNYNDLCAGLTKTIATDFAASGLTLSRFMISNISVPPEVEAALDKRSQMGAIGDLDRFTKFQVANSIPDAARNEGGAAGMGMGMGAGAIFGAQMAGSMQQSMQPQAAPAAAPAGDDVLAKLGQIKKMLDAGLIEKSEYDEKKKELLAKL